MLDASIEGCFDIRMENTMSADKARAEVFRRAKVQLMRIDCCRKIDAYS